MSDLPIHIDEGDSGHIANTEIIDALLALPVTQGLRSARPGAGTARRQWWATDQHRFWRDDGSAWQQIVAQEHLPWFAVDDEYAEIGGTYYDSAFASALTKAKAVGGVVLLGPRDYPTSDAIDSTSAGDVGIVGCGKRSRIVSASATSNTLKAGSGAGFDHGQGRQIFRDFVLTSSVTKTSGAALHCDYAQQFLIDNVDVDPQTLGPPKAFIGFRFVWGDQVEVFHCNVNASQDCLYVDRVVDLYLGGGCKLANVAALVNLVPQAAGIHLVGGSEISVEQTDTIFCDIGLRVENVTGINYQVFLGPGAFFDTCGDNGIWIHHDSLVSLMLSGAWSASNGQRTGGFPGGNGILVDRPNPLLNVVIGGATHLYSNQGSGASIDGCKSVMVSGAFLNDNGLASAGGHGLNIGNGVGETLATGNAASRNGNSSHGYGMYFADGSNNYLARANLLRGNAQGSVREPSSPPSNRSVGDNLS